MVYINIIVRVFKFRLRKFKTTGQLMVGSY